MVFNTATVGSAVAPAVIQTFLSHYLNRKPLAQKPTAHISYDEGLHLIRKFLFYASHHTVEDIQRFTSQWVPHPRWVKVDEVDISQEHITKAAGFIQEQLGHHGIEKVGGKHWWQWRRPGGDLKAEWIEMRSDYQERKNNNIQGKRVMLYVHGGAYFFGSVDEHRYQMQRHARKLKARVFARRRNGSEVCCILNSEEVRLMIQSMLVVMRDQGIPLPAGAILISPWVDLTHSFPSVSGDNPLDYIPPHGFHQRPSASWPPPTADDMMSIQEDLVKKIINKDRTPGHHQSETDAVQGFHVNDNPPPGTQNDTAATGTVTNDGTGPAANTVPGFGHDLSIMLDGRLIEIKDQIQMYASNQLISHPLVSPVLQPSLGGLPPLLILTGGGEMLRDEQIYLAHKAANPTKYAPGDAFLDESPHDHNRNQVHRWKPTDVQLQVWEDLCHVAPTLSFTRPAKYMYRSVAQFGAWALARAQKTEIEILDDDDVSIISTSTDDEGDDDALKEKAAASKGSSGQIGKAGDPLPPFKNHMIRQRVDRHGNIFPLEPVHQLPACNIAASDIGVIKEGPVKKWMAAKKEWDTKYASSKRRVQKQRAKEMAQGYQLFGNGEVPPPSALAGRRKLGDDMKEEKKKRSMGMSLWALWGSKHDEKTMKHEEEADREPETATASAADGQGARPLEDTKTNQGKLMDSRKKSDYSRSRSRRRTVTDQHQTEGSDDVDEDTPAAQLLAIKQAKGETVPGDGSLAPDFLSGTGKGPMDDDTVNSDGVPSILIHSPTTEDNDLRRPKAGGIAFPFSLKQHQATLSMTTLTSAINVQPVEDMKNDGSRDSGVEHNAVDVAATNATSSKQKDETMDVVKVDRKSLPTSPLSNVTNGDEEKVVENGKVVSADRPPLETFKTAAEYFPSVNNEVMRP
ncbi:AB hydrolase superfamily [Hyphodiscus hymeniophilus]|uniref:AB hydrolase superfamily n=1 Tax=Hyphodiscus hymeniophilus TaxID=353542 RepID=A0A9P7AZJ5_9HELO|nr:AB hydrolase superfamily [Hyphodiscus hymeniophilus]